MATQSAVKISGAARTSVLCQRERRAEAAAPEQGRRTRPATCRGRSGRSRTASAGDQDGEERDDDRLGRAGDRGRGVRRSPKVRRSCDLGSVVVTVTDCAPLLRKDRGPAGVKGGKTPAAPSSRASGDRADHAVDEEVGLLEPHVIGRDASVPAGMTSLPVLSLSGPTKTGFSAFRSALACVGGRRSPLGTRRRRSGGVLDEVLVVAAARRSWAASRPSTACRRTACRW